MSHVNPWLSIWSGSKLLGLASDRVAIIFCHFQDAMRCSETLWDTSEKLWDTLKGSRMLWVASKMLWDALRISQTIWGTVSHSETLWNALKGSETQDKLLNDSGCCRHKSKPGLEPTTIMVHQISPNQTYFNLDYTHFCPFLPIKIDRKYIYTLVRTWFGCWVNENS